MNNGVVLLLKANVETELLLTFFHIKCQKYL